MKRKFLAAAVAAAPLLAASAPALAQVTISTATSTPVKTSTANGGQRSDVIVASGGSITITSAGTDLTLDSDNSVTMSGSLAASNLDDTVGMDIVGGNTGSATLSGSISITETYTAPNDPNNDGLLTGAFAQGSGRVGLEVTGTSPFVGSITNTSAITVNGNESEGVSIQAPITGDYLALLVTPASGSTPAKIAAGSIAVKGQNVVGFQVTPTGGVGGDVRITTVTANGPNAQAVQINGAVGGFVNFSAGVTATGYRTSNRQTNPAISAFYSQEQMQQDGAAVTIGANVGEGIIVSAPPVIASTTNLDQDHDGVPDSLQGTGSIVSFGSAPAMQFGAIAQGAAAPLPITLGAYTASTYISPFNSSPPPGPFSLVIQGSVSGQGLFDQLTSPFLLAPISATGMQIGGQILVTPLTYTFDSNFKVTGSTPAVWAPTGSVTLVGGLYNSGSISAAAYQADATAIHIGANPLLVTPTPGAVVTVPTIYNDGQIFAASIQVNSSTTATVNGGIFPDTPAPAPVVVTAILIEKDSVVPTIINNGGIFAELTGTGGVGGSTTAILDKSGTLQTIDNSGSIKAILNQTLATAPLPATSASGASNTVAIDMSAGTGPQTINQTFLPLASSPTVTVYSSTTSYTAGQFVVDNGNIYVNVVAAGPGIDPINNPGNWRQVGSTTPSIVGDIYMGSGPDTLNIQAGSVKSGVIAMGGGLNTINVLGNANSTTTVTGALTELAGGQFALNVDYGVLTDTNPALGQGAASINVGAHGVLVIAADPSNNRNTQFNVSGATNIASGGQIGLTMVSLQVAPVQNYTVITGAAGSITAPSLGPTAIANAPFLYTAVASLVPLDGAGASDIELTVTRKTAAQLGFNAAEASAFDAVLAAMSAPSANTTGIQQALLGQNSAAGLKSVYDQLLPNQNQGIFQALDAAVEKVSGFIGTRPDNATRTPGSSLWMQEVNERIHRDGVDTLASKSQLFGLVGGYERMGSGGGAVGVTLGYYNAQENTSAAQLGARDVGSLVEASVYYRRQAGGLTVAARGGGGYGWFSQDRLFASGTTFALAHGSWTGAFIDAHLGATYEMKLFGPYYARPEVSVDYLALHQSGYQETGTNSAFNLAVKASTDHQLTGQAVMVLGRQWGRESWFRAEVRGGFREILSGQVGDTTASFLDGTPFTLAGDPEKGGWATVGFSLKSGSQYSYLALEGDVDFRKGARRYDLRVAGRSVF